MPPKLTAADREALWEMPDGWCRSSDFGTVGASTSSTLAKLHRRGLVERRPVVRGWSRRTYEYRVTPEGRALGVPYATELTEPPPPSDPVA